MIADLRGKIVLLSVADATVGQAIGQAFEDHGAKCVSFVSAELTRVLEQLGDGCVDALVFGAEPAPAVETLNDYTRESLLSAIGGGSWPMFDFLLRIKATTGRYPRYAIGLSTVAPDHYMPSGDFSATAAAVTETLCRYATDRLSAEDVRINVLRYRPAPSTLERRLTPNRLLGQPADVANAAVALCSGLMDLVRGQTIVVDRGATFCDNQMRIYGERVALGL